MDDTPAKETPGANINKLDLSALEAFQFGTQWSDTGDATRTAADRGHEARARHPGEGGPSRRDRRPTNRPAPRPFTSDSGPGEQQGGPRPGRDRFPPQDSRAPRREHDDRESFGGGGQRFDRGGSRRPAAPPRPYVSPLFEVTFYPDDHGFNALVKAMRASSRTYELFEIARLILGKLERCVVVFRGRPNESGATLPLHVSVPDGLPFTTEEEAIGHAMGTGFEQFFTKESVEVEPPKGVFQFVNRCPVTKDLLGPPNYHRYTQFLQQHYTVRGIQMPFERYKASIEVVRDPDAVNAWLESMKKATRYTYKGESPEGPTVFDNAEDARAFLLKVCRDKIVRASETVRVPAKAVEAAGGTEANRALFGALEMQRRFPLDTANALRGRLRRENFHIFKRGSKGVTYVCAVRRKFRQPGQMFSESINRLIEFLEANPLTPVGELSVRLLGFTPPAAPAPAAADTNSGGQTAGASAEAAPAQAPRPVIISELTAEQRTTLNRLAIDLRWLVSEGYVAEYSDGRLVAHPVMEPESAHREDEGRHADATDEGHAPGRDPEEQHVSNAAGVEERSETPVAESPAGPEEAAIEVAPVESAMTSSGPDAIAPDVTAIESSGAEPGKPDVQPEQ